MNYNDKNKFNYSELITDKKYRARMILGIYAILFIMLIAIVRTGGTKINNNNIANNNTGNEITDKENTIVDESKFVNEFSYIANKNFNYVYTYYYNDTKYVTTGSKYNDNEKFIVSSSASSQMVDCLVINGKIMVKVNDEYMQIPEYPYQYINYFDISYINGIINNMVEVDVDNNIFEIENSKLLKYSNYDASKFDDNKQNNVIKLTLKNNIIVGIDIDITNFVKSIKDDSLNIEAENATIKSSKIVLEYSDFNLVDEIE